MCMVWGFYLHMCVSDIKVRYSLNMEAERDRVLIAVG